MLRYGRASQAVSSHFLCLNIGARPLYYKSLITASLQKVVTTDTLKSMTATPGGLASFSEKTSSPVPTNVITNISSGGNNTSQNTGGLSRKDQILLATLIPILTLLAGIIGSWYSGRTKRKHDPKVPIPTSIVYGFVQDVRGGVFVISNAVFHR